MLPNFLLIAWRNLLASKLYSFITISGLALGLACGILLGLFVANEYSFDRFYPKAQSIYRVYKSIRRNGQDNYSALTAAPLAQALTTEFPEVEAATRLLRPTQGEIIGVGNHYFTEKNAFYADANFFNLFDFPFVEGRSKGALNKPNTVVITQSKARQYFGNQSSLGKTVRIGPEKTTYQITGVIRDPPPNIHFHPTALLSMASLSYSLNTKWLSNDFYTYVLLRNEATGHQLQAKLPSLVQKYVGPQLNQVGESLVAMNSMGDRWEYFIQPLSDIHLHSNLNFELEPSGNDQYVNLLALVSGLVLVIAAINFVNLNTARSAKRALEIGLRKALGAQKAQLIGQLLVESLVQSLLAMTLAAGLITLSIHPFSTLSGQALLITSTTPVWIGLCLIGLSVVMGLVSGFYPAFYLSSFNPITTLKGLSSHAIGGSLFRNGLVVIQFTIAIALMSSVVVIYRQLAFLQTKQLGFIQENVISITNADQLGTSWQPYSESLRKQAPIISLSYSSRLPAMGSFGSSTFFNPTSSNPRLIRWFEADPAFIQTLGLTLKRGRNFSAKFSTDSAAVILNEAAVKYLGLTDPLNQTLKTGIYGHPGLNVIGVVADFNFESLQHEVKPCAMLLGGSSQYLSVRMRAGSAAQTLAALTNQWRIYAPGIPIEYQFLDQTVDQLYRSEQRVGRVFILFTILSIVVACLGLFGLVTYITEQRRKEIGVRKVLGANIEHIVALLIKDFFGLICLAMLVAWPLAWYGMQSWLANFAHRVDLSWWMFVLSGLLALFIAMVTISFQSIKAAMMNPVKSLRSE